MHSVLSRISTKVGRNALSNFVRTHSHGGVPGENLPFDLTNRYKLTLWFILYAGSGFSAPYLICRHQLLKK
ncbi:cytochrome c oxidase subunit 7C, mitochondrial-like [Hyposmocoma kahamanoa]|uniref:cytochrome c oxidase subunit 7C, mitochondrial-like n=1 Tax=Hyposmocoma kahamanoa TaxID=1477025 RepID=UPI000E6D9B33|nr:cytochrome c oxidase subunit 7C, mitochondrial-like [Hyposmocoma kahamanoa]